MKNIRKIGRMWSSIDNQSPSFKARSKTGMTQEDFAKKFGISVSTIRNHDQGESYPPTAVATYYALIEEFPDQISKMVEEVFKKRQ